MRGTMSETERRVRFEVCRIIRNISNWPAHIGTQMLGRDLTEPIDKIVEALLPIVRESKADAWDEGFFDGRRQDAEGDDGPRFVNPYREEQ